MAVVTPRLCGCDLIGSPGFVDVVDHLVARRHLREAAGLRLIAAPFFLPLITIEYAHGDVFLETAGVVIARPIVFATPRVGSVVP